MSEDQITPEDIQAFARRRGIGLDAIKPHFPSVDDVHMAIWSKHLAIFAKKMTFVEAKTLAFRIFDDIGYPRPYVKCMPPHYKLLGYATSQFEIFVSSRPLDVTICHEAAHLLSWESQSDGSEDGHSALWTKMNLKIIEKYCDIPPDIIDHYIADINLELGPEFTAGWRETSPSELTGQHKYWANLKIGDYHY